MQLLTIVNTVKRKSHRGNQSVTTDQITTDIVACVNETCRQVEKLLPKRFWFKQGTLSFVTGVAGTPAVYSLPSDCQELLHISYFVNNYYYFFTRVQSDREWLTQIWNPIASVNRPYYWREIGPDSNGNKQIEIFPVPSLNITANIEYLRLKSADLTTASLNSQLPDYPDQYQDVIEKGALYNFLKGFDDPLGQVAKQDYAEARMELEIGDERADSGDLRIVMGVMKYELPGFRLE